MTILWDSSTEHTRERKKPSMSKSSTTTTERSSGWGKRATTCRWTTTRIGTAPKWQNSTTTTLRSTTFLYPHGLSGAQGCSRLRRASIGELTDGWPRSRIRSSAAHVGPSHRRLSTRACWPYRQMERYTTWRNSTGSSASRPTHRAVMEVFHIGPCSCTTEQGSLYKPPTRTPKHLPITNRAARFAPTLPGTRNWLRARSTSSTSTKIPPWPTRSSRKTSSTMVPSL